MKEILSSDSTEATKQLQNLLTINNLINNITGVESVTITKETAQKLKEWNIESANKDSQSILSELQAKRTEIQGKYDSINNSMDHKRMIMIFRQNRPNIEQSKVLE